MMSNLLGSKTLVHARPFANTRVATKTCEWSRRRAIDTSSRIPENSNNISIGTYEWRGHSIAYSESGCAGQKAVCLIHGFGACGGHYRNIIPALSKQYKVYTLDLLGFGGSSKPKIEYSMDLFKEQIEHFISEHIPDQEGSLDSRIHLVGNSIGSLASLMVASENSDKVESLILLNCAGGLNNKALSDDWRIKLAMPIFLLIDALLKNETIGRYLFDRIRSKENLRNILQSLYPSNALVVDDELVDIIHGPSNDENALDVFVNIITTDNAGPSPVAIMDNVTCPMLLLWGTEDNLTPSDGPIGKYFQNLHRTREDTAFVPLDGVGHCPHDEASEECLKHMLPWLEKYTTECMQ